MTSLFNPENIIRLKTVDSTNSYTLELLKRKRLPEGTIIITNEQTAGKGQENAKWESEAGKNLTFSIILYPEFLAPKNQFCLNKSVALGIKDFVQASFTLHEISIKWPNDIYIGMNKIAGMLIVNSIIGDIIEYSVIGIGININQERFFSDAPNPISFINISGEDHDLEKSLENICYHITKRYNQLKRNEIAAIKDDYLRSLHQVSAWNEYIYRGEKITAMITGVSRYGRLILSIKSGKAPEKVECEVKELVYL